MVEGDRTDNEETGGIRLKELGQTVGRPEVEGDRTDGEETGGIRLKEIGQ